jgi:hypothetical protein
MKNTFLAGLLFSGLCAVAGCGEEQFGSSDSQVNMQVSAPENTWLEVDMHWTGAFGGAAHNEYTLYFVRRGGWWQADKRWALNYWPTAVGPWGPGPVLRRLDADTIAVDMPLENGFMQTAKYALKGYQPKGEPRP